MKTIYKLSILLCVAVLFNSCKKNDAEVNSTVIEEKLVTGTNEHWSAPIYLDNDACGGTTSLILNNNHTFTYTDLSCVFSGSWNADYSANRSGQFLNLNFTYTYNSGSYYQSFALKYSAEKDIFYALDPDDLTLEPFTKITLAP